MSLRVRLLQLAAAIVLTMALLALLDRVAPRWSQVFHVDAREAASVPIRGGDFELQGAEGPWRLSQHVAGRTLVLLYFGFIRCPDLCPNTLGALARTLQRLGPAEGPRVMVVFVSVDHRSDTPEAVSRYAHSFGKDFVGITGSKSQLDAVTAQYNSFYSFTELPGSAMKYTVNHPGTVYVLNAGGTVVDQLLADRGEADIRAHLKKYL